MSLLRSATGYVQSPRAATTLVTCSLGASPQPTEKLHDILGVLVLLLVQLGHKVTRDGFGLFNSDDAEQSSVRWRCDAQHSTEGGQCGDPLRVSRDNPEATVLSRRPDARPLMQVANFSSAGRESRCDQGVFVERE